MYAYTARLGRVIFIQNITKHKFSKLNVKASFILFYESNKKNLQKFIIINSKFVIYFNFLSSLLI